jgi:N-acyl-L-homoserine lactone synthetase
MKLTKRQLRKIIKEELGRALNESPGFWDLYRDGERGFQMGTHDFASAVHKALLASGYSTSKGKSLHQAKAHELVAKHLEVSAEQIARHYNHYISMLERTLPRLRDVELEGQRGSWELSAFDG